jgi:hypothetical protein
MRVELEKGSMKLAVCKPLDIHLRRYEDENAKNERNDQPLEPLPQELTGSPEVQRKS